MAPQTYVNERELMDELVHDVIGAAQEVADTLGDGFEEEVYTRALGRELMLRGRSIKTGACFSVMYKGASVGDYAADLIVAGRLVVDLACTGHFSKARSAQCVHYLKGSGLPAGVLITIQRSELNWKRIANPISDHSPLRAAV